MTAATAAGALALRSAFVELVAERGHVLDPAQQQAVEKLEQLFAELIAFKHARRTRLHKLISRQAPPRGVYLWGSVGRGKTFLLDSFYQALPYRRKRRVHFHAFMREVHHRLDQLKGAEDPLQIIADDLATRNRVICFDEFHVSDIADAMILARLIGGLFERGIVFCVTSNYPPDGLYPNGLQRANFLPAIDLLKEKLEVVNLDGATDYRLRTLERIAVYHCPIEAGTESRLQASFDELSESRDERGALRIEARELPYYRRAGGIVWFNFQQICGGPRSQNDYLEIARRFHTVIVSGVPQLSPRNASEARRFTWLVDVFYDCRVKLILSASAPPDTLYVEGPMAQEFRRTASRLIEMQSHDYLMQARVLPLAI